MPAVHRPDELRLRFDGRFDWPFASSRRALPHRPVPAGGLIEWLGAILRPVRRHQITMILDRVDPES
jgi:hypothetical protein